MGYFFGLELFVGPVLRRPWPSC